jgi:demethylmenaquinone methyltransferase/2-methoxy-6-polyprenyl-1,4-benzoquinol methylase
MQILRMNIGIHPIYQERASTLVCWKKVTEAERSYYNQRALEYDEWYLGTGLFAERARRGWHEEVEALRSILRSLSARTVLDVACGTGFLTRHLPGRVAAIDQSTAMLEVARARLPEAIVVRADAFRLPFPAGTFDCVTSGHFYGHLPVPSRGRFLAEARRVARQLLIIDAAWREEVEPEAIQERTLNDGSRHAVYKRYFTPEQLIAELGGGTVLHGGRWFVAVLAG